VTKRARTAATIAAVILLVAGAAAYYAVGTPHYSLYAMMRAMQRGDAAGVARFIDIDRLARHVVAKQVDSIARTRGTGRNDWDKMQTDIQIRYVQLASAALLQYAGDEIRTSLGRQPAAPSGDWALKGITYRNDIAHVEIERKSDRAVVGFDMQRQPDRRWKIVAADPEQMAALMGAP
jgi:hypothetical protein